MISFAAILCVGALVTTRGAQYAASHTVDIVAFEPSFTILYAFPLAFLSLQCHIQVPTIYSELKPRWKKPRMMMLALAVAYALCLCLYIPVSFFGYTNFGKLTPPNIMEANYEVTDTFVIVARLCLVVVAVCGIPMNHFPGRSALWELYHSLRQSKTSSIIRRESFRKLSRASIRWPQSGVPGSELLSPTSFEQKVHDTGMIDIPPWFFYPKRAHGTLPHSAPPSPYPTSPYSPILWASPLGFSSSSCSLASLCLDYPHSGSTRRTLTLDATTAQSRRWANL